MSEPKRLSAEELEQIGQRVEAATPGPWQECGHERGGCSCGHVWSLAVQRVVSHSPERLPSDPLERMEAEECQVYGEQSRRNALFIAHARQDIPDLLSHIASLAEENADLLQHAEQCIVDMRREMDRADALEKENADLRQQIETLQALAGEPAPQGETQTGTKLPESDELADLRAKVEATGRLVEKWRDPSLESNTIDGVRARRDHRQHADELEAALGSAGAGRKALERATISANSVKTIRGSLVRRSRGG